MVHKFNPQHYWKLDNPERRKVLPPEQTLKSLGLKENDLFVDIGCGTGYFTIPAIDIVGQDGKVFGLDTSEDMLNKLKEKAGPKRLERLMLINTEEYDLRLGESSVTFVLMSNVLHEIECHSLRKGFHCSRQNCPKIFIFIGETFGNMFII